jgi:hypothetical protein
MVSQYNVQKVPSLLRVRAADNPQSLLLRRLKKNP